MPDHQSQQILNQLQDPIFLVTASLDVTYANRQGQELLSSKQAPWAFSELNLSPAVQDKIQKFLSLGQEFKIYELGEDCFQKIPHFYATQISGMFCLEGQIFDNSEGVFLLRLSQGNASSIAMNSFSAQQNLRQVSSMAAMLAHEVKNPLASIKGAAQFMAMKLPSEDQDLAVLIASEVDRLARLINQFEGFSDQTALPVKRQNIHRILDYAISIVQNRADYPARNIDIETIYDPSLPEILADFEAMVQVILNLLLNAVEALEKVDQPIKKIWVRTKYQYGVKYRPALSKQAVSVPILIEVADNGNGIEEGIVAQIFDPFITSKETGSGLGLATVAKIVEKHSGIVQFSRKEGQTIFSLSFPVAT